MRSPTHIPQSVKRKAATLIAQLQAGLPPSRCRGKRLKFSSRYISIPVGSYRLLCRYQDKAFRSAEILHHAAYDNRLRRYLRR